MFLLRSAFWLILAFIIIAPAEGFRERVSSASEQTRALATQHASTALESIACSSIECVGGKAVAQMALQSVSPAPQTAPVLPPSTQLVTVAWPVPRPSDLI